MKTLYGIHINDVLFIVNSHFFRSHFTFYFQTTQKKKKKKLIIDCKLTFFFSEIVLHH